IKFPANLTIRNLPKPHNESIDYFSYNRSYQQAGNDALIFNETYAVTERSVPAIEYNTVRKFFDKIKSGMAEKVILTK
ncbi:MAG TPA: hypothetical protein PLH27_06560, partial [bacterium]|nr:hypothetical protein [bacterium]